MDAGETWAEESEQSSSSSGGGGGADEDLKRRSSAALYRRRSLCLLHQRAAFFKVAPLVHISDTTCAEGLHLLLLMTSTKIMIGAVSRSWDKIKRKLALERWRWRRRRRRDALKSHRAEKITQEVISQKVERAHIWKSSSSLTAERKLH